MRANGICGAKRRGKPWPTTQAERAGLAGEAADELDAPADLDEGALEQVRAADPLAVLGRPAQVRDQRVEVALYDGHRRLVGAAVIGDDRLQLPARVRRWAAASKTPTSALELAVVALGQLAGDVAQRVHGA